MKPKAKKQPIIEPTKNDWTEKVTKIGKTAKEWAWLIPLLERLLDFVKNII